MAGHDGADKKDCDADGVLRRLLQGRDRHQAGAGRAPQLPRPARVTPARAAATAVGRAADHLYHLAVQPVSVTPGALTLAELPEYLPEPALLTVLQGRGESLGVVALSGEAVTALIEVQALGRITARPSERRKPTRADAMICAEFVNQLMSELATEMVGMEGFEGIDGYRYATYLDDPRPLSLMLEDKAYRSLSFELRLGSPETRDVTIFIAIPHDGSAERPAPEVTKAKAEARSTRPSEPTPAAQPGETLKASVDAAPVELVGVLCRRHLTLAELRALTPGKVLSLPRVSLAEARIETTGGQVLATGKFGEAEGCHAIRLHDPQAGQKGASEIVARPRTSIPAHEPPMVDLEKPDEFRTATAGEQQLGETGRNVATGG